MELETSNCMRGDLNRLSDAGSCHDPESFVRFMSTDFETAMWAVFSRFDATNDPLSSEIGMESTDCVPFAEHHGEEHSAKPNHFRAKPPLAHFTCLNECNLARILSS
jgi:hypothetical protein